MRDVAGGLLGEVPLPVVRHDDLDATGTVAVPGDAAYDALVSPWNVAIPVRPAVVGAAAHAGAGVEAVR